jgi:N-acetylglucosaminyldiphosphoundecaprenol N-acetyl-beta-D-mannosaminyltransferase
MSASHYEETRTVQIFGIPVHSPSSGHLLEEMDRNIRERREPRHISITSSELMYNARRISFLPDYIRTSRYSLCDSTAVALSAWLRGVRIRRLTGPTLMELTAAYGVEHGWRHFFCGGAQGVAELLSQRLTARFPGLQIAGVACPPFRELSSMEEHNLLDAINATNPDLLWVGLGVVKQELWIVRHLRELRAPWVIGVGGAFDYHAGTVNRAPRWMQRLGLEWSYRLYQEPWRWRRISSSFVFLFESALGATCGRAPVFGRRRNTAMRIPQWKGRSPGRV